MSIPAGAPNLATQLRSTSLRSATALFASLFGVGALLGVRQVITGDDPMAFVMPSFVCLMSFVAWLMARNGRETLARTLFVATCGIYLGVLVVFAPFPVKTGLGFPLSMLTILLLHLTHPAHKATRLGGGVAGLVALGYVAQAVIDVSVLADWAVVTSAVAELLVLAFSTIVLGWLGKGWLHALQEADQARAQLVEAHSLAMQANRAKSSFLASMSHELRTPLNAVIGYAELAQDDLTDDRHVNPEDLEHIRSAGQHLLSLVNQVLDLSRIEAGKLKLERSTVLLHELAREVGDILGPQLAQRHNRLVLDLEPVEPASLDPLRTRQILTNLLGNATKFTEHGTITVVVRQEGDRLRAAVSDDGPGIPPHRLEAIFAPFEQASDEVQGTYGGTGLGLAISRRLAREMGGNLWAESELGHGATFFLEFPVSGAARSSSSRPLARLVRP